MCDAGRMHRVPCDICVCSCESLENRLHATGPDGIGALITQVPEVLLCKPSNLDRWDRRLIELAAFWSMHGHCDVPEVRILKQTC